MDLLHSAWIPVTELGRKVPQRISLRQLLCEDKRYQFCLPRDDMEMAAMQLILCLVQVMCIPENFSVWRQRGREPLSEEEYQRLSAPFAGMFDLQHPDHPFMQTKGVKASEITDMDKLLTGLSGSTNCAFVNEPGQAEALCPGCTAIVLFNQANNAPGFGGGFKSGLRGGAPVTTLLYAEHIRTTLWFNILTEETLNAEYPVDWRNSLNQPPVWIEPIKSGESIPAEKIGLLRGLFWQPAHIELLPPLGEGLCTLCGQPHAQRFSGFYKEKFNFTVEGMWLHPHSPRLFAIKKGIVEQKFLAFTTAAPSWTQLSRVIVKQQVAQKEDGQSPAIVVNQAIKLFTDNSKWMLMLGGYRNNQASIIERRHDVFNLSPEILRNPVWVQHIVTIGLEYKKALRSALYLFYVGLKSKDIKMKGTGVPLHEVMEPLFYSHSESAILDALSAYSADNEEHLVDLLRTQLDTLCRKLFNRATDPYLHHPAITVIAALTRRKLGQELNHLQPQKGIVDEAIH